MDYADTPRTNAGNTTYTTDGHDIDNLSMEKSSISPLKKENDLLLHMKSKRGTNLRTPRLRTPLHDRNKNQTAPGPAEFTPLLKSVTKRNLLRAGKENGGVQTPAFLRDGYKAKDSPALETGESYVLDDESVSSAGGNFAELPDRAIESSSAQSTPLAVLPKRIDDRLNHANPLPLREQEEVGMLYSNSDGTANNRTEIDVRRKGKFRIEAEDTLSRRISSKGRARYQSSSVEREHGA